MIRIYTLFRGRDGKPSCRTADYGTYTKQICHVVAYSIEQAYWCYAQRKAFDGRTGIYEWRIDADTWRNYLGENSPTPIYSHYEAYDQNTTPFPATTPGTYPLDVVTGGDLPDIAYQWQEGQQAVIFQMGDSELRKLSPEVQNAMVHLGKGYHKLNLKT